MNVARTDAGLVIELDSEQETERLGQALADVCAAGCVIGLIGPLGAGKTWLVRAVAESLGVDPGAIASPTFVLIQEFEDLGVADYWSAGGVCLVEWADRVRGSLPVDTWQIRIEPLEPTRRRVEIAFPASAAGLANQLANGLL